MEIGVYKTCLECGQEAGKKAAQLLKEAIAKNGTATFIAATGASQFHFLQTLIADPQIDWSKTRMFHLDEYIGLPESHPASFRKYLKERFIGKVNPGEVNLVNGEADPEAECKRLQKLISRESIDVAFVGIGENGHLAFNDPPADFETEDAFIVVELDEKCRNQQLGEGWFKSFDEVPEKALSMGIKQIMKAKHIICTVPDARKAEAVRDCFGDDKVSNLHPASILKQHPHCYVFLDAESGSLLSKK
ncbi:MAG: glucosamine-6-phosphate deaminase [bacterium]|nr:glucosamine-6-phosphate deaminase [bacterium]MDD3805783.1 glucosamine-6-phosphate deaminase [bacterium]MDD4153042.1 glucosamine-6-phosphate deaminase [bacterium]